MSDETAHEPPANPEIHFEPIVSLPAVEVKSLEENEEELFQSRAKLYRYDKNGEESEWKERGVGVMKVLKHTEKNTYRILMRRDKTLKICANHLITIDMELKPNCGSDKAWVWSVAAEFADEECKSETLAIKFGNAESAKRFKDKFEECQKLLENKEAKSEEQESEKLAKELEGLNVKESKNTENAEEKKDTIEATTGTSSKTETKDNEQKKKEDEDVPEK